MAEWDEWCWCIQDEATEKNLLNKQKEDTDLSERKILDVNMLLVHKGFHRELTEETTSWLVLWSTIHLAPFRSAIRYVDSSSHRAAAHFPSSLFPFSLSFFFSFLPVFLSSFPFPSHICRITTYRCDFPKYLVYYHCINIEEKVLTIKSWTDQEKNWHVLHGTTVLKMGFLFLRKNYDT